MGILSKLEPNRVFYYFEEICQIPHGSTNTKEISDYCVNFAKSMDCACSRTMLIMSLSGKWFAGV